MTGGLAWSVACGTCCDVIDGESREERRRRAGLSFSACRGIFFILLRGSDSDLPHGKKTAVFAHNYRIACDSQGIFSYIISNREHIYLSFYMSL